VENSKMKLKQISSSWISRISNPLSLVTQFTNWKQMLGN